VPLCTTLASDNIYEAFLGSEKRDALLHGHSYTAHAVGCHVANTSINTMLDMDRAGQWQGYKDDWVESTSSSVSSEDGLVVWSVWSRDFIQRVSKRRDVESVVALGSVLAISLHDRERGELPSVSSPAGADRVGYNSSAAAGLLKKLLEGSEDFKVHSRVLGNVFYLMAGQMSKRKTLLSIEHLLLDVLPL
jgi:bifunctional dethiobiotin synthetase / adenosylmethionine---8-amino-7-oxononanoate aminotransferase